MTLEQLKKKRYSPQLIKPYTLAIISVLLFFVTYSAPKLTAKEYEALVDIKFSPYIGAENLITTHLVLEEIGSYVIASNLRTTTRDITGRFIELVGIWEPINAFLVTTQHEVFGHGYRIRDLGLKYAKVNKYKFSFPPPYGPGGGSTHFSTSDDITTSLMASISMAGVEATAIMGSSIKKHFMVNRVIDPKQAGLYIYSAQDLTNYIWSMEDRIFPKTGHDIENYVGWINLTYDNSTLKIKKLKKEVISNLIDPMTWYSLWGWIKYVFTGRSYQFSMFQIGNYGYLPNLRLGLTPFGEEFYLENYFVKKQTPFYLYARYGQHAGNSYYGIGLEHPSLFYENYRSRIGMRMDLYRQPHVLYQKGDIDLDTITVGYDQDVLHQRRYGLLFFMSGELKLKQGPFSLKGDFGYKTTGYVPGYPLKNAPIVRFGIGGRY